MNKLLNAFIYPATIAEIDRLKTLKQKEALARKIEKVLKHAYDYLTIDYILTYKAYCYLLDKHYPNHQEKLPQFITTTKDYATVNIFKNYMDSFINDSNSVNIKDVLSTFEFTNTVYYSINEEKDFMYLNLLFKDAKLPGSLVLALKCINYYRYYENVFNNEGLSKIPKNANLKHLKYTLIDNNLPITITRYNGYTINYYSIKESNHYDIKTNLDDTITKPMINFYLYLLTCNTLPNRDKIDYYWNTLAQSFIDVIGVEILNDMIKEFKQLTNSSEYYLNNQTK